VVPNYTPKTVSTDGWKPTPAAWKSLFKLVVILLRFLHGWLKSHDWAKHLKDQFAEVSRRVREWAGEHLSGVVLENVLDLCRKGHRFAVA
jgi:hypothetical protein